MAAPEMPCIDVLILSSIEARGQSVENDALEGVFRAGEWCDCARHEFLQYPISTCLRQMSDHLVFTHGDRMLVGFGGTARDHMIARSLPREQVKLFCHSCRQSLAVNSLTSKHGTVGRSTLLVGCDFSQPGGQGLQSRNFAL